MVLWYMCIVDIYVYMYMSTGGMHERMYSCEDR